MLDIILTIITLIALIVASYTDMKTREVPDWLSYSFLFSILGVRLIFSLNDWFIIVEGLLGFIALFAIGYLLYLTSQWGGGDTKLLMGLGAALGISLPFSSNSLLVAWFFIALLLIGAIYGLFWLLGMGIKNIAIIKKGFLLHLRHWRSTHFGMLLLTIVFIILSFINKLFIPLVFFPLLILYLLILVQVIEKKCFLKHIPTSKLTEGDWLAEDVKVGKTIHLEKKTLEKADILKLRKMTKRVKIKEGIPFVPSFLITYVLFLLLNWFKLIESFL